MSNPVFPNMIDEHGRVTSVHRYFSNADPLLRYFIERSLKKGRVRTGYVYLIRESASGTIKIGRTTLPLRIRINQLTANYNATVFTADNPRSFEFIHAIVSHDSMALESAFHWQFGRVENKGFRVGTEYFYLSNSDIDRIRRVVTLDGVPVDHLGDISLCQTDWRKIDNKRAS